MLDWGLLDPLSGPADSVVGDDAVLAAMIAFERALAVAQDLEVPAHFDEPDRLKLLAGAREHGNPVIPLVDALRKQGGDELHRGATSQDVVDSALDGGGFDRGRVTWCATSSQPVRRSPRSSGGTTRIERSPGRSPSMPT